VELPYLVNAAGPFAPGVPVAFNTFTTKQDVSPRPVARILPGMVRAGSMIKIEADGEYSSLTGAALTLGLYHGTHVGDVTTAPTITADIALSSVITTGTTPAAWPWRLEWRGRVTKTGSSGSMVGCGTLELGTSLIAETSTPIPITAALRTVAVDFSTDRAIGVSATWGASSASNQVMTYDISVLILN
jgi:hypothetical protein